MLLRWNRAYRCALCDAYPVIPSHRPSILLLLPQYSATKSALHALSRVLEMELKGFNVQVMLVAAGGVKSGFGNAQLGSYVPASDSKRGELACSWWRWP